MRKNSNKNNKNRGLRIALTVLGLVCVTAIALVCAYRIWVRPPQLNEPLVAEAPETEQKEQDEQPAEPSPTTEVVTSDPFQDQEEEEQREQIKSDRKEGVYTILLVGNDDKQGNTDTILVGKIDTVNHKMDFITIPRDTAINVPWIVRKINCVYWGSRYSGGDGISALKKQITRLTGFEPDCYVVVDLNVFVDAVDLVGGVYFDVPIDMYYEDPSQDLTINLKKGYQLLDGYQAMGCVRFRKGYPNGDLGRIETQHKFLSACASQFLDAGNIPHMAELMKLLADNLDTDLSAANMAFFAEEFLKCKAEDIRFYTPNLGGGMIAGYSYVTLDVDQWLEMVNELLNPFNVPITRNNVDIVYCTPWGYEGTQGLRDPDYYLNTGVPGEDGEDGNLVPGEGGDLVPGEGGEEQPGTDPGAENPGTEEPAPAPDDGGAPAEPVTEP